MQFDSKIIVPYIFYTDKKDGAKSRILWSEKFKANALTEAEL